MKFGDNVKPRIRMVNGFWQCYGRAVSGHGKDHKEAYARWLSELSSYLASKKWKD